MAQFLDKAGAKLICDSIKSVKDSYLPLTGGTVTGTINVDEISSIGKNPMIIRGNSAEDQILFYAGSKENPVTDINFQIINGNDGLGFSINQKNYPISDTESVNTGLFLTTKNTAAVYSAIPFFNSKQFGVIKKTPSIDQFFIDQYKSPSVKPFIVEGGALFSGEIENLAPTGTIPFKVSSTTLCPNLNADMLDGKHADDFATKDYVDSKVSGVTGGIGSKVIEISEKDGGYIQFYGHFDDREEDVSDTFRIRPKYNALYIENTSSDGHDIYLKTEDGSLQIGDSGSATFRNTYVVIEDFGLQLKTKGSQPIRTESTSLCPNLNADLLDGYHADDFATKEYVDSKVPGKFIKTTGTITLKLLRTITGGLPRYYIHLEGAGMEMITLLNSFIVISPSGSSFYGAVTNYGKIPINECYWYTKDSNLYVQIKSPGTCNLQARAYETAVVLGNELKNLDFEIIENPDLSDVQLKSFDRINNVLFDGDTSLHKDFNADMVDGKHASDFADATDTKTKLDNLQSQINNISTSGGGSTIDASGLIKSGTANNAVVVGNLSSNTASGAHSFATGNQSKAIGAASFVSGFSNEATGMRAFAANSANKALGVQTAVFGEYNTASALAKNTFVAGEHNDVDGDVCFVAGYYNTVSGTKNAVFGKNNTIEANGSREYAAHNLIAGNGNAVKANNAVLDSKNNIIGGTLNIIESGGSNNLVLGNNNNFADYGDNNIVGGQFNTIHSHSSLVGGGQNEVNGSYNIVGGHNNTVTGSTNMTVGAGNTLGGSNSMAFGQSNRVNGKRCFGAGYGNQVGGSSSFALGQNLIVDGDMAIVVGAGNEAYNEAEFACGEQNKTRQSDTWGKGGTLFTVGNGVKATKHNALEIRQNGDIYIADTDAPGEFYEKPMRKLQDMNKIRRFVFVDGYMPIFAKPYHVYFTDTIKLNALIKNTNPLESHYISMASARMMSLCKLYASCDPKLVSNSSDRALWPKNIFDKRTGFDRKAVLEIRSMWHEPFHLYAKLHFHRVTSHRDRHFGVYFDENNVAHEYHGTTPNFGIAKERAVALLREFAKMVNDDNLWGTDIVEFNHQGEFLEFEYYRRYQRAPLETGPGVYKRFPKKLWHRIHGRAGKGRQWTDSHGRKRSTMIVNYYGLWNRYYWRARVKTRKHKSDWVYFVVTHPLERQIKIKILDN